jgi:hypothetical protein
MKNDFIDYFLVLEVHYLASNDIIKAAYRRLSQKYHPDAGGNKKRFQMINDAYDTLIHVHKRKGYMKTWLDHHAPQNFETELLSASPYDLQFNHLKEKMSQYLDHIRDNRYTLAYSMLCKENTKRIFVKDFVQWQKLISEIHHLLEYDSAIHEVHTNEKIPRVVLKVKVKEYNQLLHRVETDYFYREMIYENAWMVSLKNVDVRATIRKYKKILAMNKKIQKKLPNQMDRVSENHMTKFVSKKYFINNCEYEWMRFDRYGSVFSILSVLVSDDEVFKKLEQILFDETRSLDAYCIYKKKQYFVLLPETKKSNGNHVVKKLVSRLNKEERACIEFRISESLKKYSNVKEMFDRLR